MAETRAAGQGAIGLKLCWVVAALWLPVYLYSVAQLPGSSAAATTGALQGLAVTLIAIVHGSLGYGWKGFAVYAGIAAVVSFALEASSIATGFPFGFFTHNSAPGPYLLGVPTTIVVGYAVLGWYAWSLARMIVRANPTRTTAIERFTTPLIAAIVLAGFDYPSDPIGSTVRHMWSYRDPSGQFGVPLTNYLGWVFTGWCYFQLFALVEHRFRAGAQASLRSYWALIPLIWLGIALYYPIAFALAPAGTVQLGASRFVIADIYEAAVAASLFSMVFAALVALARLAARPGNPTEF